MTTDKTYYDALALKCLGTFDDNDLRIMSIGMIPKVRWDAFLLEMYDNGSIQAPFQEDLLAKALYRNAKMVV